MTRSAVGKIYVTFAEQDAAKHDDAPGPGRGFVDVLDPATNLLTRLISRDPLDSPWGLAIAPANFGELSGDLLVGNFGDGLINAFDANTGASRGRPRAREGLTRPAHHGCAGDGGVSTSPPGLSLSASGRGRETDQPRVRGL